VSTLDSHGEQTCAQLFQEVLAPWESTDPLAFPCEALKQVSAELVILRAALTADHESGPLDDEMVGRAIVGIENRARVAAEVAWRLFRVKCEEDSEVPS